MRKKTSPLQRKKDDPNSKYWRTKADKLWSECVLRFYGHRCMVCGADRNVQAHHLIPREMYSHRHHPTNGVALCPSHHKYSVELSAHRAPVHFMLWLLNRYPGIWIWLAESKPARESPETCKDAFLRLVYDLRAMEGENGPACSDPTGSLHTGS